MFYRLLAILLLALAALAALAACAGKNVASAVATQPKFEPTDQSKCKVGKSQARPLVVEWPSADRASLESRARRGVLAVRYDGCEMEVLDRCRLKDVKYAYSGVTPKGDRITIRDSDELYTRVPLGAAKLEGALKRSGELNVQMTIVGTWEADAEVFKSDDLVGDCGGATHVIAGITVGAFDFYAGADADVGASGSFMTAAAGGQSTAKREMLNRDGDAADCEKGTTGDKAPPEGCGAILRIEVVKLGEGKKVAQAPAVHCPEGSSWDGKRCVATAVHCPEGSVFKDGRCSSATDRAGPTPVPDNPEAHKEVKLDLPPDAPVRGQAGAPITVQVFADLQDPFSARAMTDTIPALLAKYGRDLKLVFRHYPLPFHPLAEPAAELALEAKAQRGDDAFWKVVDAIYTRQSRERQQLDMASLEAVARSAQLNVDMVKSAIATKKHGARIQRDVAATGAAGVLGTPTFFFNGEKVMGAQPLDKFEAVVLRLKGAPVPAADEGRAPRVVIPVPPDAPARGPASARVTIQVFADLQCPFSAASLGGANGPKGDFARFLAAHKNEIRLVYRHHPLPFHTMAETAHNLALEAKAQKGDDGFWRVVHAIYKAMNEGRANPYDQAFLEGIARAEGLDVERAKLAMSTKKYGARILQDDAVAKDMGTPTFIIGDEKIVGAQSAEVFEAVFARAASK